MTTEPVVNSQRSIYDERYEAGLYDRRSAIHVLTAEREALAEALNRTLESNQDARRVTLFDFGYGTGRVTNELIKNYQRDYAESRKDLRVVAYDVSSVGLQKAQEALCSTGFTPDGQLQWEPDNTCGYVAGSVSKEETDVTVSVVFVHGNESESPEFMHQLALKASDGDRYLLTTSWYSGLGHVPSEKLRREYFRQLGALTSPTGEIVFSMSATGDLVEIQPEWSKKLDEGSVGDFPVAAPGDLVYVTELGQDNFYHVFSTDLNDHMTAITSANQHWWVRGIRYPDEEFNSTADEQANYRRVREANRGKRGRTWNADDYRQFHTVAAFRSPRNPDEAISDLLFPACLATSSESGTLVARLSSLSYPNGPVVPPESHHGPVPDNDFTSPWPAWRPR
jgi:hypothetical protein